MDTKEYKRQYYLKNKARLNTRHMANYYANKPRLEDRTCDNCPMTYSPSRVDRKFCSRDCGVAYWRKNNQEHSNAYFRNKYATDLNRKIGSCLRSRLRKALKGNVKSKSTISLLGCTIEELKKHLESKFESGMTWDNWTTNGWHIDHIRPIASFDLSDPAQQKEACSYTNLQPLWAEDNLSKGVLYAQ